MNDAIPREIVGGGTSKMRIAAGGNAKQPPEPVASEDAEDAPSVSRPGVITTMSAAARNVRDAASDETPAEGTTQSRPTVGTGKPPRNRRRPGWGGLVAAVLAAGPGWTEIRGYIEEAQGKDEAVASAGELGEFRGRLDEQSANIRELAVKISANTAADLEARSNSAIEFRHLDGGITDVGKGIDQLLTLAGVPPENRPKFASTPPDIVRRHDEAIERWRALKAKAERDALERSIAASDTFGG